MVPAAARRTIWNVPHNRNPLFTGREELLAQIPAALQSGQPAALTQTLSGLGGVGKTQLAVEYAYRHASEYTLVWWLRAEEPTTLTAEYARLAEALDLPEKDAAEQAVAIGAVRRWLERNDGWLLIFDNANEPQDVQPYRPRSGSGHVLITSRSQGWRGMAQPLSVQELPREEAVEFLLRRTGQTDADSAAMLADALGDLPLALEQAGAYIDVMSISLTEYLRLFESYQVPLLDEALPTHYPLSITKTWELAFQQVQQHSPAADLLHLCAFLAPDNIPLSIIRDGAKYLPEPLASAVGNPLELNRAIRALLRYSLVERQDDMLSVHRMVQAVTRARLDEEGQKLWAGVAMEVVNKAFPFQSDDVRTWEECGWLMPHALLSTDHAEKLMVVREATSRLLNQTGVYLRGRADFQGAKIAYERALRIAEQVYGPQHRVVAVAINNLGMVLHDLNSLTEARGAYERALQIGEQVYGPQHREVAVWVNNLGTILYDLGDLTEARAAYERALRIAEQVYGPQHRVVAVAINNLGRVLQDLGDLDDAHAAYERSLRIDEQIYRLEHPDVATDVNNLGSVLRVMGNLEGARLMFERALRIFRKFLGDDHPDTRLVQRNLESLIRQQQEQGGE